MAVSQIVGIQCVFFDREDSLDKVFCRTVKNAEEGKESLAVEQGGFDGFQRRKKALVEKKGWKTAGGEGKAPQGRLFSDRPF